jgi:hypothetical protein
VRDLANTITQGKENWYDKAKAVEDYFDLPEFVYDQTNVAIPEEGDDYVDQFLFETKSGYCDNFSTSMVVLMRSIGIPTRWVKGYTEGESKGTTESGYRLYEITNNNAHSWVEVYFPDIGWVPFEPTKGFSNNVQFVYDNQSGSQTNTEVPKPEEKKETAKPVQEKEPTDSGSTTTSFSIRELWDKTKMLLGDHWDDLIFGVLLLGFIVMIIFRTRLRWLPYFILLRFKWRSKDEDFPVAYLVLLRQLGRYGLKRKPEQTLHDYARYIDKYFSSDEMKILTSSYERYVYKGHLERDVWDNTKELWKKMIRKTIT